VEGRLDEAIYFLEHALRLQSDFADARAYLGLSYARLHDYREAVDQLSRAFRLNPNWTRTNKMLALWEQNRGTWLGHMGNWEEAAQAYQRSLDAGAEPAAYHGAGTAFYYLGRFEDSVRAYESAIRLEPSNAGSQLALGKALGRLGRYADAEQALLAATKLKPDSSEAHYDLGWVYGEMERRKDAVTQLQECVKLAPTNAGAHCALGVNLAALGSFDEAVQAYLEAIRLRPDYGDAHCNLGAAYGELGRHEDAIRESREAVSLGPDDCFGWTNLAIAYHHTERYELEIDALTRAIQLKPNENSLYLSLAQCHLCLVQYEAALESARKSIGLNPGCAESHFLAGCAMHGLHDYELAGSEYERALQLEPNHFWCLINLGYCLAESGRNEDALVQGRRAMQLDQQSPHPHDLLGLAHCNLGNREAAVRQIELLKEIDPGFQGELKSLFDREKTST
jgi:tetratricopeptide (TPR) repeat protein